MSEEAQEGKDREKQQGAEREKGNADQKHQEQEGSEAEHAV